MNGAPEPNIQDLPRIRERISFIYLERCIIERRDSGVASVDSSGVMQIPIASTAVIMLGPGTSITHGAIELLGESGTSIIWVGERGSRYCAHGSPLTHSSRLLESQARLVSNKKLRVNVARKMYQLRFSGEDVSRATMQQLRGKEGSRVRSAYRRLSKEYGVEWGGREYNHEDPSKGDAVNRSLSIANSFLYGAVQSVIVAMGCSPGLGFVHTGHERSFVYDIADLYKVEVTIPVAFEVAATGVSDIFPITRRKVRDAIVDHHIMERCVRDLLYLLDDVDYQEYEDRLDLWDDSCGFVRSGTMYGEKHL